MVVSVPSVPFGPSDRKKLAQKKRMQEKLKPKNNTDRVLVLYVFRPSHPPKKLTRES